MKQHSRASPYPTRKPAISGYTAQHPPSPVGYWNRHRLDAPARPDLPRVMPDPLKPLTRWTEETHLTTPFEAG